MDHVQELRGRLFYVAVAFVVAACATYPFVQDVIRFITKPLGTTELYYLTPAGGLSLIIKVCMYAGFIGILPVVIYQLYRFISPVMRRENARAVLGYTVASTILAAIGIAFAYFVSLPAALHFLTGIELKQVTPMLTIDAYLSFIVAYLVAGAMLFQLPLVLLIINSVTPLSPRTLMSYERHLIVVAFLFAAVISPTPDVVNQTILAAPMVLMYQIGIALVWLRQRSKRHQTPQAQKPSPAQQSHNYERVEQVKSVPDAPKAEVPALVHYRTAHPGVESQSRSVDGIRGESRQVATAQRSRITVGERRSFSIPPQSRLNRQTIDGIL
jgi:sec-independent protein translocase protein TatC